MYLKPKQKKETPKKMKRKTEFNKFAKESANLRMQNKTKLQHSVFISTNKKDTNRSLKAKHFQTSLQITSHQEIHALPSSPPQKMYPK